VKHVQSSDVKLEEPTETGVKDVKLRWLISKKDGAKNFAMRLFEIKSGGYTPLHQHNWEHEVFVLEGNGLIRDKTHEKSIKKGDVIFVTPMEWHQFVNISDEKLKFLCLIPNKK
jgi:quercetin dioxygenase-like cupin family protein